MDRYHLLDILSTDLPLNLTIPTINENVYWKRCYIHRWPKSIPHRVEDIEILETVISKNHQKFNSVSTAKDSDSGSSRSSTGKKRRSSYHSNRKKSWKEWYVEMYVREYLEKQKPENYDAEKVILKRQICL